MIKPIITVFTSTYNRCYTLSKLWKSLKSQTCYNFEWIIIDDGSTDDTLNMVNTMITSTKDFRIIYRKVVNGGKHRAINYGLKFASGDLFFIVDSDDWLPNNAIEIIIFYYNTIKGNKDFAGVAGCKYDSNNNLSGETFSGKFLDATSLEREKYGIKGEKAEVFRTELLKKYTFPEYDGEKFISEAIVWDKIANDGYKLRWFNENVYIFEYQNDGITNNLRDNYKKNPKGYLTFINNEIKYKNVLGLKKYIWYGRAIDTVKSTLNKKEILKYLEIDNYDYYISNLFYFIYNLVK